MENFQAIGYAMPVVITFWIFVGLVVLAIVGAIIASHARYLDDIGAGLSVFATSFGVVAFAILLWILIPFDGKYHQAYRVTGEVQSVSNVLTESSGELTRQPVLTVSTIDRDITMTDPRAVNLQGKTVDFTCYVQWNPHAADSYSCSIYQVHDSRGVDND